MGGADIQAEASPVTRAGRIARAPLPATQIHAHIEKERLREAHSKFHPRA
jgi:hypothetical protein